MLALQTVSGRMLAEDLLGEGVMALDKQIDIVRTDVSEFANQTLAEANIRARTGCTLIAVERGDDVISDLGPEFSLADDDSLIIVGSDGAISRFDDVVGVSALDGL